MQDQLEQSLAAILAKATAGVEAGVSFLSGQIPDVIQQLLMWKFVEACLLIGLGLLCLVPALLSFLSMRKKLVKVPGNEDEKAYRYYRQQYVPTFFFDNDGDLREIGIPVLVISAFLVIFGWVTIFCKVATAVQIWVAPKVYLIEYAASLAKGG